MKKLIVRHQTFYYEKVVDEDPDNYTYELYTDRYVLLASAIAYFQGVREIAKAYTIGKEEFEKAVREFCF